MNTVMNAREWCLLGILSFLWGGAFFGTDLALADFGPTTIVAGRVGIGAAVLWCIVLFARISVPGAAGYWWSLVIMGFLNNVIPFMLISWGQTRITGSLAATLIATTPIFSVLLARYWSGEERLTMGRIVGIGLGICGVTLLVDAPSVSDALGSFWGQVAILGAAASYGVAAIYGRRLRGRPPILNAAGQVTMSTLVILPVCLFVERPWMAAPDWLSSGALVTVGVFGTGVAYAVYFKLLASAGATNVLLVTLLVPLSATGLGMAFLDEALSADRISGMALIFAGLLAIDGRLWRAKSRVPT